DVFGSDRQSQPNPAGYLDAKRRGESDGEKEGLVVPEVQIARAWQGIRSVRKLLVAAFSLRYHGSCLRPVSLNPAPGRSTIAATPCWTGARHADHDHLPWLQVKTPHPR